ncbi:MAG: glycoside hydrolase family 32 protein [Oscillospiraceae bacterium]|nr:glycoside hydrolase family 32 protein [Oscillospiraceae bacterium]
MEFYQTEADKQRLERQIGRATQSVNAVKDIVAQGRFRQGYHLMPPAYWMNDPNGFIYYKGRYHLFYQHNPYSAVWANMHWGHASSEDLVHWIHHPIALAPSEPYDTCFRGGCYSGSSVVAKEKLIIMYTANLVEHGVQTQKQCLAWSDDGIHFSKYHNNPVIDCPKELDAANFRDPKIWKHGDLWYCVVASRINGDACCAIFRSTDLIQWEYKGVLVRGEGKLGSMWECPDFFPLEDKYVLQFSPMNLGVYKTVYLVGDMDYDTCRFTWKTKGEIDAGFDFYGPQTMQAPDGRRIMIGWQNAWDWMPWFSSFGAAPMENWCGCMSIPREITLGQDDSLQFKPVDEIKLLRNSAQDFGLLKCAEGVKQSLIVGDNVHFELNLDIDLHQTNADSLQIHIRHSDFEDTLIQLDFKNQVLTFDRSHSDFCMKGTMTRPLSLNSDVNLSLNLFSDTSSIELFVGDTLCMDCAVFAENKSNELFFESFGGDTILNAYGWQMPRNKKYRTTNI